MHVESAVFIYLYTYIILFNYIQRRTRNNLTIQTLINQNPENTQWKSYQQEYTHRSEPGTAARVHS